MLMKKVLGAALGVAMMVGSCIGSESFSSEKDSSLSSFETKSKLDVVAQLPMLKKCYNEKLKKDVIWYTDNEIWIKGEEELQKKQKIAEEILKNIGSTLEDREVLLSVMDVYNDIHYELDGAYLGLECAPYKDPKGFTFNMTNIMIQLVLAKIRSIPDYSLYTE